MDVLIFPLLFIVLGAVALKIRSEYQETGAIRFSLGPTRLKLHKDINFTIEW